MIASCSPDWTTRRYSQTHVKIKSTKSFGDVAQCEDSGLSSHYHKTKRNIIAQYNLLASVVRGRDAWAAATLRGLSHRAAEVGVRVGEWEGTAEKFGLLR